MAQVLNLLETQGALVVHGSDGLDEITLTGDTYAYHVHDGRIDELLINPGLLGFDMASRENLLGGDAAENADTIQKILSGESGPKTDIVLLNAGAAIYVAGLTSTLSDGVERARKSISDGAALKCLHSLRAISTEFQSIPGK